MIAFLISFLEYLLTFPIENIYGPLDRLPLQ